MRGSRWVAPLMLCAAITASGEQARAAFHLWRIQEVFTNASGSVQFIELFCPPGNDFEDELAGHSITATSDGSLRSYTLAAKLPSTPPTGGRTFLIATPSFDDLAGSVAPDYATLPTSFFNPDAASITINFAGVDVLTFAGSALPKNGTLSLLDTNPGGVASLTTAANSPKNFAGAAGSINAAPPLAAADFTGNGSVDAADLDAWRTGYGKLTEAVRGDGDADNDDDVDAADFLVWQQQLTGAGAVAGFVSVPEPATLALASAALALAARRRRRRRAREKT